MIEPAAEAQDRRPSLLAAAALQDSLLSASNDLDRLQTLLADACDALMQGFCGASEHVGHLLASQAVAEAPAHASAEAIRLHLGAAVTALQFQDMASQLIAHTHRRLRNCADQLAQDAFGEDPDGATVMAEEPLRPNPVTQDEMDAGSIDLF